MGLISMQLDWGSGGEQSKQLFTYFERHSELQFNLHGQQSEQESLALGTIRATLFFPVGSNQSYHLNSLKATKASLPYLRSNQSYDLISMLDGPIRCIKPRVICQLENIEWISSSSSTRGFIEHSIEPIHVRSVVRMDFNHHVLS
jgi:hypothetical protein